MINWYHDEYVFSPHFFFVARETLSGGCAQQYIFYLLGFGDPSTSKVEFLLQGGIRPSLRIFRCSFSFLLILPVVIRETLRGVLPR